jgi:hypothetical protein
VLDLWFEKVVKEIVPGESGMVRYADDFVCCFQSKRAAYKFYKALKKRLAKFGLEIAEEKSEIIEFGRFAASNRRRRGEGKPETFDFLGFTHYCSKSRKGRFRVKRKTSKKKFKQKVKEFKEWIRRIRNVFTTEEIINKTKQKLVGHFRYYGITDNIRMLSNYKHSVQELLFKWLNRRSQRRGFNWDKFNKFLKRNLIPKPKIYISIFE